MRLEKKVVPEGIKSTLGSS
jgi:hypothetical protein